MLFGTHLVDTGTQSTMIKSYFSAIKHVLKTDGYEWNESKIQLVMLTRSCKILNDRVKIRLPIKMGLLDALLFEIERRFSSQPYLELMYKTAFLLAYYGLMRVGELASGSHPVKASDVHVGTNKQKILLVLCTSKTHGLEARPQKIKISALDPTLVKQKFFCPFQMVAECLKCRGSFDDKNEPFLIFSDRSPVQPVQFHTTLRSLLTDLNLDPLLYDTHSFCIGRSSDMYYKFNYTLDQVRQAGRWKSSAILKYLKN